MSRYHSFNDFMTDVINEADSISRRKNNLGLEELFAASPVTFSAMLRLIDAGWFVFLAVVALFALGWLGLIAALVTFFTTPVGMLVLAALGVGAAKTIKKMYEERILPETVKYIGEKYKSSWEPVEGNHSAIDRLLTDAAEELYNKALHSGTETARRVLRG